MNRPPPPPPSQQRAAPAQQRAAPAPGATRTGSAPAAPAPPSPRRRFKLRRISASIRLQRIPTIPG